MNLREQLIRYIEGLGVSQVHIAKKVGISTPMLSLFKNGERELGEEYEKQLRKFLNKGFDSMNNST